MKDGQHVKFTGEGDQEPGLEAGDIIIVLEEKEHSTFQRHGQDLVTTLDITLVEALCGMIKIVTTLDKRSLVITTIPGQWFIRIINGSWRCRLNKLKFSLVRIKDLLGNSHFNTLSLVFGKCMKISLSSGTWIIVNKSR